MSAKTSKPASSATKVVAPQPFDKLYWLRVGLGVLGGLAADRVFVPGDYVDGLLIGVIFYLLSYYVARYAWFKELPRENLGKIYSTGIGSYVLVFLFTWILLVTLAPA